MASVFLAELDADYIAPSQACTNPLFSGAASPAATAPPAASTPAANGKLKLTLEMEVDDGSLHYPSMPLSSGAPPAFGTKPDLIRAVPSGAGAGSGAPKAKATVSLNDCLACSGCVTSAETVLISQQSSSKYFEAVQSGAFSTVVVSVSPQSRAALAAHLGLTTAAFLPRFTTFWQRLGAHYVTDTSVAADLSLLETAAEFVARYRQRQPRQWAAPETSVAIAADKCRYPEREGQPEGAALGTTTATTSSMEVDGGGGGEDGAVGSIHRPLESYTALPMLASACPGWVCYAEKTQPSALPYISTAKSPQQTMGSLLKFILAREMKVAPASILHVTVMPCFDKKLEASRRDFFHEAEDAQEVDLVLTTGEVLEMLGAHAAEAGLGSMACFTALPEASPPDATTGPLDALLRSNWTSGSGRGVELLAPPTTLGGSGGYLEFVFRYAAKELFGVDVSTDAPLPYKPGRNDVIKELVLEVGGEVVLNFAIAYGFRNIQSVIQKMRRSKLVYHYVEVMACPSGCLNGGGQLREATSETSTVRKARVAKVQSAFCDGQVMREPGQSPFVQQLYSSALGGQPFSDAARRLLHTSYHAVPKMEGAGAKW
jgi:iron only hydrogenase large subunit-like protein